MKTLLKIAALSVAAATLFAMPAIVDAQTDDEEEFSQTSRPAVQDDAVSKAVEFFNAGQKAHSEGDLAKALELYDKAIELLPEFPEAEYQKGAIYETQGRSKKAEAAYRNAVSLKPDWTLPMSALGGLLVSDGEFGEAESVLNRAIGIDPMCIPCYPALTDLYLRIRVPDEKLRLHLQKLTYLTTKVKIPANIWAAKAAIERALGDRTGARASLKRAFEIDPADLAAASENVELLIQEGDSGAAVASARAILARRPDSIPAKIQMARALRSAGETSEAIALLEAITDSRDADTFLKEMRASTELEPQLMEKRLAEEPENAMLLGSLCTFFRTSDPAKSLKYCLKASEVEPSNINHAIGYGAALLQLKRYPEAAALLKRLSTSAPENYTIRANLATALFQLGSYEDAKNQYLWITDKQPDRAAAYFFLAICFDKLDYYIDAMANYQRFLKLADPADFSIEIDRVNLRLPSLQRQIKERKGKR